MMVINKWTIDRFFFTVKYLGILSMFYTSHIENKLLNKLQTEKSV